jgi:hypothetical protein
MTLRRRPPKTAPVPVAAPATGRAECAPPLRATLAVDHRASVGVVGAPPCPLHHLPPTREEL